MTPEQQCGLYALGLAGLILLALVRHLADLAHRNRRVVEEEETKRWQAYYAANPAARPHDEPGTLKLHDPDED